jgi:hypothetical protein
VPWLSHYAPAGLPLVAHCVFRRRGREVSQLLLERTWFERPDRSIDLHLNPAGGAALIYTVGIAQSIGRSGANRPPDD